MCVSYQLFVKPSATFNYLGISLIFVGMCLYGFVCFGWDVTSQNDVEVRDATNHMVPVQQYHTAARPRSSAAAYSLSHFIPSTRYLVYGMNTRTLKIIVC